MQQDRALSFGGTNAAAAVTAMRQRLSGFTRSWTQLALETMRIATSEMEVMRTLFANGSPIGDFASESTTLAALAQSQSRQARIRYEALVDAQRRVNDAMAKVFFSAWENVIENVPENSAEGLATNQVVSAVAKGTMPAKQAA